MKELAAELRMSPKSIQRAYRKGEIPVQWLGHISDGNTGRKHQYFRFEAGRRGARKIYFLCLPAYTVPTRRGVGTGEAYKLLIFGGPCRGRTYGPLIKSEPQGMTQVVECLGHPRSHLADRTSFHLFHFVPIHLVPSCIVA